MHFSILSKFNLLFFSILFDTPPIILTLKKYLSLANLKRVVLGLFLASLIYGIYATFKDSKTAYFLLTSRAWEMLLGGLAFLYPWSLKNQRLQLTTQYLGLVLILASYIFISKDTLWPGYMALIPVLGAYLIIVSNYQQNLIINNPVFNHIGKWSYSIYVWHWPLVVLGFYFSLENWWMYGIPLSIILGFFSYHAIEKLHFPRYSSWKEIYKVKALYLALFLLGFGHFLKTNDGVDSRLPEVAKIANAEIKNDNPYDCDQPKLHECVIGNPSKINALIIGDSHANSLITSLSSIFNTKSEGIVALASSACPFIPNINFYDKKSRCPEINQQRSDLIASKKYENIPIVLVARYPGYLIGENDPDRIDLKESKPTIYFGTEKNTSHAELFASFQKNLTQQLCQLSKTNPVYIVQPIPEVGFNLPQRIIKNIFYNRNEKIFISYDAYVKRNGEIRTIIQQSAAQCQVKVLDPSLMLCKGKECISEYQGRPIYRDSDHLSEHGNKLLTPMFKEAFNP